MKLTKITILLCGGALSLLFTQARGATYPSGVPKSQFLYGEPPNISSKGSSKGSCCTDQRGPIDHYQTQSDHSITQTIRNAIYDDPSLDRSYNDVTISTVKGRVTLRGTVNTVNERNNIQSKARESVAKGKIDNQIKVDKSFNAAASQRRGPIDHYQTESDRSITQAIRNAIYDDSSLDDSYNRITISTVQGYVTLNGNVSTINDRNNIEDKTLDRVSSNKINNQIVVQNS